MKSNIFKKIFTPIYLTIFLFGLFVPFSQTFAAVTLTTTTLESRSVILKVVGLLPNTLVIFQVKNASSRTQNYNLTHNSVMSNDQGMASDLFSGLNPGGQYIGTVFMPNNNFLSLNFTTPDPNAVTLAVTALKSTSITLKAEKLAPNSQVAFQIDVADSITPKYFKSQKTTSNNNGSASSSFSSLSPNGKYVGTVVVNNYVEAKVDFSTPTSTSNTTNPLTIFTDKTADPTTGIISLKNGDVLKITATSTATTGGETVNFLPQSGGISALGNSCAMPAVPKIQSCFITFQPTLSGITYTLGATVVAVDGKTYTSNDIKVATVADVVAPPLIVTPNCVPPKKLNADKTDCVLDTDTTYTPLAPLPGLSTPGCVGTDGSACIQTDPGCEFDENGNIIPGSCKNPCPFGNYLNIIIKLVLGIAGVLAMVMIVMGGIQYMTSDLVSSKGAGKETIQHAILGLLIALGAYLILNTINPQLLTACLDKLPQATITILPFDDTINSYVVKTNSASCKIVTSGDCAPANLKNYFGDKAENASKICNIESGGIANLKSNFDYCSLGDNVTFSFGLFQINLLANGDKIPKSVGNCTNLFTTTKGEEIGYGKAGYIAKDENKNFKGYDCKLAPNRGDNYKKCRDYLLTASGNLEMAKQLFTKRNKPHIFQDWYASDNNACPSAFQ